MGNHFFQRNGGCQPPVQYQTPCMPSHQGYQVVNGYQEIHMPCQVQGQVMHGYPAAPQIIYQNQPMQSHAANSIDEKLHINSSNSVVSKEELSKYLKINQQGKLEFNATYNGNLENVLYSYSRTNNQGYSTYLNNSKFEGIRGNTVDGSGAYVIEYDKSAGTTNIKVVVDQNNIEAFRITIGNSTYKIVTSEAINALANKSQNNKANQAQDKHESPKSSNQLSNRDSTRTQGEIQNLHGLMEKIDNHTKAVGGNVDTTLADQVLMKLNKLEATVAPDPSGKYPTLSPGLRNALLKSLPELKDELKKSLAQDPFELKKSLATLESIQNYLHNNSGAPAGAKEMPDGTKKQGVELGVDPSVRQGVQLGVDPSLTQGVSLGVDPTEKSGAKLGVAKEGDILGVAKNGVGLGVAKEGQDLGVSQNGVQLGVAPSEQYRGVQLGVSQDQKNDISAELVARLKDSMAKSSFGNPMTGSSSPTFKDSTTMLNIFGTLKTDYERLDIIQKYNDQGGNFTEDMKYVSKDKRQAYVNVLLGSELNGLYSSFYNAQPWSYWPMNYSDKGTLAKINSLDANKKKLLSTAWDILHRQDYENVSFDARIGQLLAGK